MKSSNTNVRSSVVIATLGLIIFSTPLNIASAEVPPAPTFEVPTTVSDIPTPPEAIPTTPVAKESETSTTTTTTETQKTGGETAVSSGGNSGGGSSHSGGRSSRRSSGGGSSSKNTRTVTSTQIAGVSTYSTAAAIAMVKCSSPALPATDLSGDMTLAGLIDLFVALGIIPQDRAARACAALTTAAGHTTVTNTSSTAFTKTLHLGMTDPEVVRLQQFLNARGFTVAKQGLGSKGHESAYYSVSTGVAVARFQETYRAEILTPRGLQSGTGNFDQATMTKANQLLGK
jgi:hypothetical protein